MAAAPVGPVGEWDQAAAPAGEPLLGVAAGGEPLLAQPAPSANREERARHRVEVRVRGLRPPPRRSRRKWRRQCRPGPWLAGASNVVLVGLVIARVLRWQGWQVEDSSPSQRTVSASAKGAVFGALAADALALQTHNEYDFDRIAAAHTAGGLALAPHEAFPKFRAAAEKLVGGAFKPGQTSPPLGGKAGDQTDAGDALAHALGFVAQRLEDGAVPAWSMATFQLLARRLPRRAGGRGVAAGDGPADFLAVAHAPAAVLLTLSQRAWDGGLAGRPCTWADVPRGRALPVHAGSRAEPEPRALAQCAALGPHLCGGITCDGECRVSTAHVSAPTNATATYSRVMACASGSGLAEAGHAAVEAAAVTSPHATALYSANLLARLVYFCLGRPGPAPTVLRDALQVVLQSSGDAAETQFWRAAVAAAETKLAEAKAHAARWGLDPADRSAVDDRAAQTLAQGPVPAAPEYPCASPPCDFAGAAGKGSDPAVALPVALYLLLRYAGDGLAAALQANVALGGDAGSRAIFVGAVAGALYGEGALPSEWWAMRSHSTVRTFFGRIQAGPLARADLGLVAAPDADAGGAE